VKTVEERVAKLEDRMQRLGAQLDGLLMMLGKIKALVVALTERLGPGDAGEDWKQ